MKKKNIEDILALTPMQEGLLFHYLQDRQGESYFNQLNLEVSGEIDLEYFEKSWNLVIETNEILRTVFRWEKLEKPTQVVLEKHTIHLKYKDLAIIGDSEDKRKQWETIKQQDRNNPFDLQEVPFRVTLGKITQNQHHILISYHHILFDGWSIGIILKEFFQAYETLVKGSQSLVPPVKPRFKEFIRWHQEQDPKEQKKFWQNYLEGFETPTQLPVKQLKPGPGIQSKRNYRLHLPEMIKDKLEVFVKEKRLSLATFFYSAWGVLLQKYCCMEDVVFGTVVSGRSAPIRGIEDMVGLLINTIPHRARLEPGDTLLDFLVRINNHLAAVGKYENIPLVDIHSYSQRPNQVGEELFDTIVAVENYPLDTYLKNLGSHLSIQSYEMEERPHYDLTLVISAAGGIDIDFIYNNTCFDKETIVRLAHHFGTILKGIGENVENRPQEIEILSGEEKHQLLVDFNRTAAAYPGEKAIHELFEEQVERTSDNIAVIGPLEMEYRTYMVYISYQELNEKSNRLAHLLRSKGVQSDTIVSIMLERSLEMVIGILGILKAGGGYLPIAVDYPQERIQYMLTDSRSKILLTNHEEIGKWNWVNEKIVNCQLYSPLERGASSVGINGGGGVCQNLHLPPAPATAVSSLTLTSTSTCQVSPANLAYVIYTSGSTGKPKGVMVEHGPVVNLLFALQHRYPLREQDTYLLKTSYLFDVSVTELFGWFLEGGRLAILQPGGEKDPKAIREMIAREGVTHINFVPSMFRTFVEILDPQEIVKLAGLKYIFLAGEALLPGPVNRFRRLNTAIAIENIYGPTEAAVYAGWYSLADWKGEASIPIGKPLPNVTLYIVDKWGYLQPIGVPGELRIGGKGLARGYLNRPELTADKFDHDLWDYQDYQDGYHRSSRSYKSYVLYKTGDLARWLPDGNIEFLGRMDHQVKIRGFRIELGEIEHRLFKHDEIKEAVVVPIADARGDRYLCAYIAGSKEFDTSELREFLSAQLPDYMVPSHFVQLEAIPLTSNGKINRKMLPSPGIKAGKEYVAPGDEVEKKLARLWAGVLGIERSVIGVNSNFFELGGHSLKAAILAARIYKELNVNVSLSEIFKRPTIEGLSGYIKGAAVNKYVSIEPVEKKEYYPLSSAQKRMYILQQMAVGVTNYNMPAAFVLSGVLDIERLEGTFGKLIERHESFRSSFEWKGNEPVQRINQENYKLQIKNTIKNFIRPFDLAKAPLLRVGLIKEGEQKHILMVDMHHIVLDGTSMSVLIKEFMAVYAGEEQRPLKLQYKDFAVWQNKLLETGEIKKQEQYWLNRFKGNIPSLDIPTTYPRSPVQDFAGDSITFSAGDEVAGYLKKLAQETGSTLFMVLLAAYNVLLYLYTGQEDIVVGTPVVGRVHPDLDKVIGMFANTLALRNYPHPDKTFRFFLEDVKENSLKAFENQDYQFEMLIEVLGYRRDTTDNPLFDTMFALQNMSIPGIKLKGLELTPYQLTSLTSHFDILLEGEEKDGDIIFSLEYRVGLFEKSVMETLTLHFINILKEIVKNPGIEIAKIEMRSQDEREKIVQFNNLNEGETYEFD